MLRPKHGIISFLYSFSESNPELRSERYRFTKFYTFNYSQKCKQTGASPIDLIHKGIEISPYDSWEEAYYFQTGGSFFVFL